MHGKEKDVLRQIQELFCLRDSRVCCELYSEIYTTNSQTSIFREESLGKVTFQVFTWMRLPFQLDVSVCYCEPCTKTACKP